MVGLYLHISQMLADFHCVYHCDAGNPIARLISRLDLQRNRMWVKLRDSDSATVAPVARTEGEVHDLSAAAAAPGYKAPAAPTVSKVNMFDSDDDDEGPAAGASKGQTTVPAIATVDAADQGSPKGKASKAKAKGEAVGSLDPAAGPKTVEVEFDLTLSAYANARKMYAQKKVAYQKEAKTVEASAKVLQQVGERVLQGVESQKLKRSLRAARKVSLVHHTLTPVVRMISVFRRRKIQFWTAHSGID